MFSSDINIGLNSFIHYHRNVLLRYQHRPELFHSLPPQCSPQISVESNSQKLTTGRRLAPLSLASLEGGGGLSYQVIVRQVWFLPFWVQYTLETAGADAGYLKGGPYVGLHAKIGVQGGPALGPMIKSLHRGPNGGCPDPWTTTPPPHHPDPHLDSKRNK